MSDKDSSDILIKLLEKIDIPLDDVLLIKQYIQAIISESMQEAMLHMPKHNCPIPKEDAEHVPALMRVVKNIGDGDMSHGIERLKKNHDMVTSARAAQGVAGKAIFKSLVILIVIGLCTAVVSYFKLGFSK